MFWDNFVSLCSAHKTSPNAVAAELNLSSGSVTAWKRGAVPRATTLRKISDYFSVPYSALLDEVDNTVQKENPAAQMSSGVDKEILDIVRSLDADQKETALAVLQALVQKKGK